MAISQPVICPIFVGRTPEVTSFEKLLSEIQKENTFPIFRVVMITGEAGIGKTRFVNEVTSIAGSSGMTILVGRCFEQDHALPYSALIDLLRLFCRDNAREKIQDALQGTASQLLRIFPELTINLIDTVSPPILNPEQEKQRIFQALVQFLRRAGGQQSQGVPLILIVEDVHWADDLSLEFLLYLARHKLPRPLLLVVTARSDERHEPMERLLSEWNRLRILTEIRLPPLSLGESDQMLRGILNVERPVKYDLLDALHQLTEGNPFFIEEAIKALGEDTDWEHIATHTLQVPRTVQLAVQHRLDHLSPAARKLVSIAAVIGRRFPVDLLQKLIDKPAQELTSQLRELRDAQILIEESADVYAFRHALTREAIYQDVLGLERRVLHGVIASALLQNPNASDESLLGDLSYHFFESADWAKAFEYAQRAGQRAQSLDATRAALVYFTRAIDAARHAGKSPPLLLLRARGQSHQTLGNFEAARADYEAILQAARESKDRESEWRSLLDLGFAWTSRDYQRAGDYFQQALEAARQLDDFVLLAQTLNRIGNWRYMSGDPRAGLALHREALEIVEHTNEQREIANTLDLLGISSFGLGDLRQGREFYERAIGIYRTLGDRQGLIASLCAYPISGSSYMTITGVPAPVDMYDLIHKGEEAVDIARQMGWSPNESYALSFQTLSLGPHGEFQRALEAGERSLEIAYEIGHDFFVITGHFALGALYLDLLNPELAREHLEKSYTVAHTAGAAFVSKNIAAYLAQAYLTLNEVDRAATILQEQLLNETTMNSEALRTLGMARVEFLLKKGLPDQALALIRQSIASTPHIDQGSVSPILWLLHARALRALERNSEAQAILRDALEAARTAKLLPLVWRVHLELGMVLRAMRRLTEAREQWNAARETIQHLGRTILNRTVRQVFLERALGMMPSPSEKEKIRVEFSGLTEREREIAALIAAGSSNNQIAERLVLSRRTVEAHVANIMSKLGLRVRAQIAAWAVEKGLIQAQK